LKSAVFLVNRDEEKKMNSLNGKVAVVTGSTRGIGRTIAETLAKQGARVVVSGRQARDVDQAVEDCRRAGIEVRGKACDVRKYVEADSLMRFAAEETGGIDILINNAGIGIFNHAADLSPEEWDRVIDTNLTGVFYCCHAAIPFLRERGGGYIFNISSLAGKNAFNAGTAYNASKFGLEGLSEALMLDLRYENIKVSYIMPGSVATEFAGRQPTGDWKLTPGDVAKVVLDLLAHDHRALASRVELRPFQPPRKK
jgi:NAD(P)-dependent dehydrogenase (short-subunit alcohol dehydrogenase family)